MAHLTAAAVTAGPHTAVHAGISYQHSQFTLSQTASGSLSIALAAIPGGARIVDCILTLDNGALFDTPTAGTGQCVEVWTGGNRHGTPISTATGGVQVNQYNPNTALVGYRVSSSSHLVYKLYNSPTGSGTATTVFNLAVTYDCQLDGD